jgi:hypothetical protein
MSRSRNIKPGFFSNEDLAECSPWTRLCFAGLWTLADREGRLENRAKRIKGHLFPFDTVDVEPLLVELEARGFIYRYASQTHALIQILEFSKHQNPHHKEAMSTYPSPKSLGLSPHARQVKPEATPPMQDTKASDKPETLTPRMLQARGQNPADSLIPDSLIPDSLLLIPDSLQQPLAKTAKAKPAFDLQGFESFWSVWPRKTAKAAALKAWVKLNPNPELVETICDAVNAQLPMFLLRDADKIPHPATWLNGQRWLDEIEKPAGPRQAQTAAPSKTFSALQKLQDMKFHDYPNDKPELAEGRDHRRLDAPDASEP